MTEMILTSAGVSALVTMSFNFLIEWYRHKNQRNTHRDSKLVEKKYEVLPELYKRYWLAYSANNKLIGLSSRPDFSKMDQQKINEFFLDKLVDQDRVHALANSGALNVQKCNQIYNEHLVGEASDAVNNYNNYLLVNALFIEEESYKSALKHGDLLSDVNNSLEWRFIDHISNPEKNKEHREKHKQVYEGTEILKEVFRGELKKY
jgi:hypothetical protein